MLTKPTFPSIKLEDLTTTSQKIISLAHHHTLWCFYGEMGAGKTTLIKEICIALGVSTPITSPTFSLVNEYQTQLGKPIYHFDFYRINSIEEVYDIGYEDYFYSGHICLIEWPEKISEVLNDEPVFNITITKNSELERDITIG